MPAAQHETDTEITLDAVDNSPTTIDLTLRMLHDGACKLSSFSPTAGVSHDHVTNIRQHFVTIPRG